MQNSIYKLFLSIETKHFRDCVDLPNKMYLCLDAEMVTVDKTGACSNSSRVTWGSRSAFVTFPLNLSHAVNLHQRQKTRVVHFPLLNCRIERVPELPLPGSAAKSTAVFVMSLISSLLKTKCLWILLQQCSSHLSAVSHSHYPPALPVSCEESCWRKDEPFL